MEGSQACGYTAGMSDVEDEYASSGSESDYEEMFTDWTLDDHIKQMATLQREFQELKRM